MSEENKNELLGMMCIERAKLKAELESYQPIIKQNQLLIEKLTLIKQLINKYNQ